MKGSKKGSNGKTGAKGPFGPGADRNKDARGIADGHAQFDGVRKKLTKGVTQLPKHRGP